MFLRELTIEFMEISNEMIYEFLKEFKADVYKRFEQIDKQFELMDKRFEQTDSLNENRFKQIEQRLTRIENLQAEDHKILLGLLKDRDNLKLSFTRTLLTMTGIFSGVIAIIISLITGKAIIYAVKN